jgi:hypothetical protein
MKDTVDADGEPDFTYHFYGVHSGARDSGFFKRAKEGEFNIVTVTALQRPGWSQGREGAAKRPTAARRRRTTAQHPRRGRRRRVAVLRHRPADGLPRPGPREPLQPVEVRARCCRRSARGVRRLHPATSFSIEAAIAEVLDLPSGYKKVWGGMDVGLTNSPTVITLFSEEKVGKATRLKLIRRIHLERMRTKHDPRGALRDRLALRRRAAGLRHGHHRPRLPDLAGDGGRRGCARRTSWTSRRGYFFNAKVPVGVDKSFVTEDGQGRMRDHLGAAVTEEHDPLTGITRYVTHMPMIEASTRYLREMVDPTFLLLPFDPEITSDMQGETTQRVKRIAGLKNKPNAFHILDSMRAMAMIYNRTRRC